MHIVLTGANRGIGLELARQYLARGDAVTAGVRSPADARELASLGGERLRVLACDVAHEPSVRAFAEQVAGPVDVLINNAGLRVRPDELDDDLEGALRMFAVNALGALRVTRALLSLLRAAPRARVANLSSGLGSIADNTSGGAYGYRMSKAALNMASRSLAQDLAAFGVCVVALSPGWVQTDMGGAGATLPVEDSVRGMLEVIDRMGPKDSGQFLDHRAGKTWPW